VEGDSVVEVVFFVVGLALALVVVVVVAEVFWRFAGGGAALAGAGKGADAADAGTRGANASAGSIAKMPPLVLLLVGVLGEPSSLSRIVRGGSDDSGGAPNGWMKGATAAGGTRKGSTGKPERRESKFVGWSLVLPSLVLPRLGHENMYGLNRPDACC